MYNIKLNLLSLSLLYDKVLSLRRLFEVCTSFCSAGTSGRGSSARREPLSEHRAWQDGYESSECHQERKTFEFDEFTLNCFLHNYMIKSYYFNEFKMRCSMNCVVFSWFRHALGVARAGRRAKSATRHPRRRRSTLRKKPSGIDSMSLHS